MAAKYDSVEMRGKLDVGLEVIFVKMSSIFSLGIYLTVVKFDRHEIKRIFGYWCNVRTY